MKNFVAEKVKSGQYSNASEIVNDALGVLQEQEEFTPKHAAYLKKEVRRGLKQLGSDMVANFDAEQVITQERRRAKKMKR